MTTDENGYLSHRQILVVMSGLLVGMFLSALDQSIVGTALPRITSDLGGFEKLSWVVTSYMLAATASTPLWGKISDLYGRRLLFQIAIVTFLVGSLLSGFSQSIDQLIAFRAIQGLGGGGLMALAMATIGDVIPPRERGRYQGYMALTFGASSVLGPVLGGFFADGPGWQWIFFINIPLGLVALVITSAALKMPHVRNDHKIDYLGAAVVVASVSSILLYTAWAGPTNGWGDSTGLALLIGGLLLAVVFVFVERRASEPIIPMRLFGNRIFSLANAFGFLIGVAMFGSMVYLPVYLQVVDGMSPTKSGLAMLPMIAGIFTTNLTIGRIMARNGRTRVYPIMGAATITVALVMLSLLTVTSPFWYIGLAMYVFGMGLGLSLQVIMVVVQNSVERSDIGVATSSVQFFRQMGGSFGTALFGAVLSSRLAVHLAHGGAGSTGGAKVDLTNVEAIKALPAQARRFAETAFNDSLTEVFLTAVPLVVIALVVAVLIPEKILGGRQSTSVAAAPSVASTGSGDGSSAAASSELSPTSV